MSEFKIYISPASRRDSSPHRSPSQKDSLSPSHQPSPSPVFTRSPSPVRSSSPQPYRAECQRLHRQAQLLQRQLDKAIFALRNNQDYRVKYEATLHQLHALQNERALKDKEMMDLGAAKEHMALQLEAITKQLQTESVQTMKGLITEKELWKQKAADLDEKLKLVTTQEEERATGQLEDELSRLRRNFERQDQDRRLQLERAKRQLKDKDNLELGYLEKMDKLRREKDQEISRLSEVIENNREEYLKMVGSKNQEIDKVKNRFDEIFSKQMSQLQRNMSSQDRTFSTELKGLKQLLQLKNKDIEALQEELKAAQATKVKERGELNHEIQLLKDKIYEKERQHQDELLNATQRMGALHAADLQGVKSQYEAVVDGLKEEIAELRKLIDEKDKKMSHQLREYERNIEILNKVIADRDQQIKELKEQANSSSATSSNEANNLKKTLAQLKDEKELTNTEYQTNMTFLKQQISKLTASNELKNNEIRELHEETAALKRDHFQSLKQLEEKWKLERKEREAEREQERNMREQVEEELRDKENAWKVKERQLERENERQRREKSKFALSNDELEKELARMMQENARLEESLRQEIAKTQSVVINTGGAKRELAGHLDRQKHDLEALKRMEIEQVRKKYDLEVTRLTHLSDQLQADLTKKTLECEKLQEELKKLAHKHKNAEKISKEKMASYHKKMASLNSQILLTQNLYQSLVGAKAQLGKPA